MIATEATQFKKDGRQKSTAFTSKGIKAVRFIAARRTSLHGRTCT